MDDLRAALAPFDADATLARRTRSVGLPADARGPRRAAVGDGGDDRGRAGPRRADRASGSRPTAAPPPSPTRCARPPRRGRPVIVTGCGTSEHAALGAAAILRDAWRAAGLPGWGPVAAQAFELAQEPPGGGLVIGVSHEGGTAATIAALDAAAGGRRADGAAHRQRRGARRRRPPTSCSRRSRWTAAGATRSATSRRWPPRSPWAPRSPGPRRTRPRSRPGSQAGIEAAWRGGDDRPADHDRPGDRRRPRTCSSSHRAWTARRPASSRSRSRRRPGSRPRCATSRRSSTATCRRPASRPRWC